MSQVKNVLVKNRIRPKKHFGQNFLTSIDALELIAESADISKNDHVLEIGAGIGNLSTFLAAQPEKFYALEKDFTLQRILKKSLKQFNNSEIIITDIMNFDIEKIYTGRSLIVVGNLPYYITTPILNRLIEQRSMIKTILITVQKEVARRIAASPGGKDYGRLSCRMQFYTKPTLIQILPRSMFYPIPEVDSALIRLDLLEKPSIEVKSEEVFFQVVKSIFAHRRKTIINSLVSSGGLGLDKNQWLELLKASEIEPSIRGEKLSLTEIGRLANLVNTKLK